MRIRLRIDEETPLNTYFTLLVEGQNVGQLCMAPFDLEEFYQQLIRGMRAGDTVEMEPEEDDSERQWWKRQEDGTWKRGRWSLVRSGEGPEKGDHLALWYVLYKGRKAMEGIVPARCFGLKNAKSLVSCMMSSLRPPKVGELWEKAA